jgi:uncharacterized protein (TIGR00290 family)
MAIKKVVLSWSSGKDSAWALHVLRRDPEIHVMALLTTLNEQFDRVAMHAVRRELLERQADAAGIPLWTAPLPWPCSNAEYERIMRGVCERALAAGATAVAFGDLYLRDIREYREQQLARTGLQPLFPVWGLETGRLAREMLDAGVRARVTCVDPRRVPAGIAGRVWDAALLDGLAPDVDPCGENGEFHTFAFAGPMFEREISHTTGLVVERDGFVFADLKSTDGGRPSG